MTTLLLAACLVAAAAHRPTPHSLAVHADGSTSALQTKAAGKASTDEGPGDELGQVAAGIESNRRRGEFYKTLEEFKQVPWNPNAWQRQSGFINQLRKNQQDAHQEATQAERAAAQNLILAIHKKAPMFNEAARAITEESQKLVDEADKLNVDLTLSTQGFNTAIQGLDDRIEKLNDHDSAVVESLKKRMEVEYTTVVNDVELTKNEVNRKKSDLVKDIEADQKKGQVKLDNLKQRINAAKATTEKELKRLQTKHAQNVQKVQDATGEFQKYSEEINTVLQTVPETMETKLTELKSELGAEKADRADALKQLKEQSAESQSELGEETNSLAEDLASDFSATKNAAVNAKDKRMGELGEDVERFAQEASDSVMKMNSDNVAVQEKLKTYSAQTGINLASVESKLATAMTNVKSFAPRAEADVAKLQAELTGKFQEVQENRQKATKEEMQEFNRNADKIESDAITDINTQVGQILQSAQTSVEGATARAQKDVEPAVDKLNGLVQEVGEAEQKIGSIEADQKTVDQRISATDEQVNKATENIQDQIAKDDKQITNDAKQVASESKEMINDDKKNVETAMSEGMSKIKDAENNLEAEFKIKNKELEKHIASELASKNGDVGKIEDLSKSMLATLRGKTDEVETHLAYLNGVAGDDAQNGKIAELQDNAVAFMKEAQVAIEQVPDAATAAVTAASTHVTQSMDMLDKASKAAIDEVKADTKKMIDTNEHANTEATTKLAALEGQLRVHAKEAIDQTTKAVTDTEAKNSDNEAKITAMKSQVDEGFDVADGVVKDEKAHLEREGKEMSSDLTAAESDWSTILTDSKAAVSAKADEHLKGLQDKLDGIIGNDDSGATKAVADEQKRLQTAVDAAVSKIVDQAGPLKQSTATLQAIMREAKATEQGATAAAKAAADELQKNVAKAGQDSSAFAQQTQDYLNQHGKQVEKDAAAKFKAAAAAGQKGLDAAGKTAAGYAEDADEKVKAGAEQFSGTLGVFRSSSAAETQAVSDEVQQLNAEVSQEELTEQQKTDKLESAFNEIATAAEAANGAFEKEMAKSKAMLQSMLGASSQEMNGLLGKISDLQQDAKQRVSKQGADDKAFLDSLVAAAKTAATTVAGKVDETQKMVDEFSTNLASVDKKANKALEEAQHMAEDFDERLSLTGRRFLQRLEEEKRARKNATQYLLAETQDNMDLLGKVMDSIVQLEMKVTSQVKYQLGTLDLDEQKLDRGLQEAMDLEKYTEDGAIEKVRAKLENTKQREAQIMAWKTKAEAEATSFRGLVQDEFKNMNQELDLTAMDLAESQATEQWAIQQQESHLKDVLGKELHDLSSVSEARLAALAKSSGAELAKLMRNTELSAEERAAQLAKIKADARKRAQEILEENGRLQLDQETAARNLKIATDEVQNSMSRIASLQSASTPSAGLHGVLGRIKDLINQASAHMDANPDANPDAGPCDSISPDDNECCKLSGHDEQRECLAGGAPATPAAAPAPAPDAADPAAPTALSQESLLEVALRTTQQALGEDADWKQRLDGILR